MIWLSDDRTDFWHIWNSVLQFEQFEQFRSPISPMAVVIRSVENYSELVLILLEQYFTCRD